MFCDWQLAHVGPGGVDLSQFIPVMVAVDDQDKILSEMLPAYYDAFLEHAPPGAAVKYTYENLVEDWKCQSILWWLFYPCCWLPAFQSRNAVSMDAFKGWGQRVLSCYADPAIDMPGFAKRMFELGSGSASVEAGVDPNPEAWECQIAARTSANWYKAASSNLEEDTRQSMTRLQGL
jgi:hypothetical protein